MRSKRRRRYKKKKYDLFLISKIALICYLAIFGIGYMSSDTSAYFSSQSEISQTITAGIWEVPKEIVNGCGKEDTIDDVSNEETEVNLEDKGETSEETGIDPLPGEDINVEHEGKDGNPIEETEKDVLSNSENDIDCEDIEDASNETDETDATEELVCEGKDENLVEENEEDAATNEEVKTDCPNKDEEPNKEIEKEKAPADVETTEPIMEKQDELKDGKIEVEKENADKSDVVDSKEDEPQKSNEESPKLPDDKDASVIESKEDNPIEKDSAKDETSESSSDTKKDDEINDAIIQGKNIDKAEGDTNEN
ncbi:MAG: SipW-dependent-type signal peptide-containing protein [Psychrobacillus sp.]